jgi:hypothetical protein
LVYIWFKLAINNEIGLSRKFFGSEVEFFKFVSVGLVVPLCIENIFRLNVRKAMVSSLKLLFVGLFERKINISGYGFLLKDVLFGALKQSLFRGLTLVLL